MEVVVERGVNLHLCRADFVRASPMDGCGGPRITNRVSLNTSGGFPRVHYNNLSLVAYTHCPSAMSSTREQRMEELQAKKAKLAEMKRQRELKAKEASNRQSLDASSSQVRPQ